MPPNLSRLAALLVSLVAVLALPARAPAQWESVATGFDYQKFTVAGPVEVFVVRMDVSTATAREANLVDSSLAQGQFNKSGLPIGGRETVSGMVSRYNDSIGFYYETWGTRNRIIAAVNGDYWERETYPSGPFTGRPESGQVQGGWFCRRFDEFSGGSGYFYYVFGIPRVGGDVVNGGSAARQTVHFADSTDANLSGVNVEHGANTLMLFTPHYGPSTATASGTVEAVMRVNRPALPLPFGTSAFSCVGTILAVRDAPGNSEIPFDCVVLSGTGTEATRIRNKCVVGQTASFRMIVRDYGFASRTPVHPPQDWTKAYGSIGCDREMLIQSTVTNLPASDTTRDPRTGACHNANYTFLVVADGRRPGSIGMTFGELAIFMRDTLGATHGVSFDGGGSSAMWVEGKGIVNVPSDGSERATVNGLFMAQRQSRTETTTFAAAESVRTPSSVPLRSGPGLNYPIFSYTTANQIGTIANHSFNGIRASNQNWWFFQSGSQSGWAPESALQSLARVEAYDLY